MERGRRGSGLPTAALEDSVRIVEGAVLILDRRVFPGELSWVRCSDAFEVAEAIRAMVTQSSGPLYAACAGLELAAVQAAALPLDAARAAIGAAGDALATARPTNNHPLEAVERVREACVDARSTAELVEAAVTAARAGAELYRSRSRALGDEAVKLLPDGARLLTHCWMDTYITELVRAADRVGRSYEWIATETRPYLQGARLTAHTLRELGQTVTLITDGMGAAALAPGSGIGPVDAFVTAADRVSLDGTVVNKVGTLGLAVAAHAFDVPFYALVQSPDPGAPVGADIRIEDRDGDEVLHTLGRRTASALVTDAWYPAFDATPARFVTRIVTDRGAYAAADVAHYFDRPGA
ncbi:methylthioribose-1-phosphate isomerase [Microterricola viridarii]|uniref:Methylthioribose-1-phosphate isomerase n=1 Tax=Microterricola viridarii TaxID=412690 RepID=A0A0Y0NKL4_9MICO|nr:methylthioribose-1-phosphate isomerase [Microterricola viridarii]